MYNHMLFFVCLFICCFCLFSWGFLFVFRDVGYSNQNVRYLLEHQLAKTSFYVSSFVRKISHFLEY